LEGSELQQEILESKLLAEMPYLAPEQADPEAYVDDLCDLYGLGAVVYHLLTGRPPFVADSPEALLEAICEGTPEKPRKYQKNLPIEIQAIVLKMLARHPEERYSTPGMLLDELRGFAEQYDLLDEQE
jgi:serine/threonine protein kinase